MLVLSLRSQRSDWLGLVCLGLLKHGLCIPAPRQGPAAHERARGRKFLQGRDYAQFPPPPTRSLLVLHELCRKSTRNLNLLLRYTTLQTGLCSARICSIFFSSSLSSLFLCVCVCGSCGEGWANLIGERSGETLQLHNAEAGFLPDRHLKRFHSWMR